jgi:apolipoprotein N-acyltransferase
MTAIFFGILQGWSIASPWSGQAVWWWQLLAMSWLVGSLMRAESPKAAFWVTARFGIAWFCSSMWWLYISMHDYGGLAAPLAALAVLGLCALLASFYAATMAAFVWLKSDDSRKPIQDAVLFAALWLLAELLRGTVMTGLPWSAVGYAHIDGPLISAAPYVGVYGVSALAAFIAALFILTRSCMLKIGIVLVLCIKASSLTSPQAIPDKASQPSSSAGMTVRLLQGNIPQNEKFDTRTGVSTALDWYKAELLKATDDGIDLVVTAETAIPLLPNQLPAGYWPTLHDKFASSAKTAALIGIPLSSQPGNYSNSVIGLGGQQATPDKSYRYDKHHLVPFGEFVPPMFRWFIDMMHIPLGDFSAGALAQASWSYKGQQLAPNICYEDLFGEELAARFTDAKTAPTIFVNVSNIGWFGSGVAVDQHLNISRMRAIEFNRPMIRATNTGATAIIDHKGVVTHSLPRATRGTLTGNVTGQTSLTPYTRWASQYGLQPLWAMACTWVVFIFLRRRLDSRLRGNDKLL